ncbi:MAG: fibronectin type III domain-containing protein [Promethearchaeota archaeon]
MKISKILSLVLLAVLCIPLLSSNSIAYLQHSGSIQAGVVKGVGPALPSPELPHRILPISILVYSQFADNSPGEEVEHMFAAINSTFGTDYYWTNLTDYTDLATELPHHDILLIPEQENAFYANMTSVAAAWSTSLTNWVNDGGIVICADGRTVPDMGYAPTARIYNETGLMTVHASATTYPVSINLVNTSDALARDVAASWTSASMTINFDTSEQTVVVDDGTYPIVLHKVIGKGHAVLIGFDYYSSDINMETILGNAIRLHRHVVFDASHSPYGTIFGTLSSFADDLVAEGFAVTNMASFSPALINACDVLVITTGTSTFSSSEADTVEAFVLAGGGLFIITDYGSFGEELDPVSTRFGFTRYTDYLTDTDDTIAGDSYNVYDNLGGNTNLLNHSITLNVSRVELDRPGGLDSLPSGAIVLARTDTDGTSDWSLGSNADGIPLAAALVTSGNGRVTIVMDYNFLSDTTDVDVDGTNTYFDSGNDVFAINNIRWLSAAGIKERIVLFDNSHSPILGYDINTHYLEWANYLTSNGYTIHWMTTFYPSLIDQAHILVITEGSSAYTNPETTGIVNYVAAGGGLFLIADWETFGVNVDPIGNQFGIDRNNTGYLTDSDDWYVGTSLIIYETPNFASHPIMQGISRIDVDRGTAFDTIGSGTALITSDTDSTCSWSDGGIANGAAVFASTQHELGRVVYITDVNFPSAIDDPDSDGVPDFYEADNNLFLVNAFQWLSENRPPIVTLNYPNGGETVNNTITITWTAFDPNKDPILGYDLLYSNDSGASWYPFVIGIMGTSFVWNTTEVPNGNNYLIRVAAFDYELVGIDDSDAVFTIDNPTPLPLLPPLPWWWWIVVLIVIIIVVVIIVYLLFRRRGTKDS